MPCLTLNGLQEEMRTLKHELLNRYIDFKLPVDESELTEFETENKVRFPAEYRAFLLEIGNGILMGNGPCKEGILSLGEAPSRYPVSGIAIQDNLRKQFPFDTISSSSSSHSDIGGYIILGTAMDSFSHFWILICDGSCRGEVWLVTLDGDFYPCTPRMTLKDWLKDWAENDSINLEQSLRNTKNESSPYWYSTHIREMRELRSAIMSRITRV